MTRTIALVILVAVLGTGCSTYATSRRVARKGSFVVAGGLGVALAGGIAHAAAFNNTGGELVVLPIAFLALLTSVGAAVVVSGGLFGMVIHDESVRTPPPPPERVEATRLGELARAAVAADRCADVPPYASRIAEIDATYYVAFSRDPVIAACLALFRSR